MAIRRRMVSRGTRRPQRRVDTSHVSWAIAGLAIATGQYTNVMAQLEAVYGADAGDALLTGYRGHVTWSSNLVNPAQVFLGLLVARADWLPAAGVNPMAGAGQFSPWWYQEILTEPVSPLVNDYSTGLHHVVFSTRTKRRLRGLEDTLWAVTYNSSAVGAINVNWTLHLPAVRG